MRILFFIFSLVCATTTFAETPAAQSAAADTSGGTWAKAIALQQQSKFEEAALLWQSVIAQHQVQRQSASGAHWNLGLCCLKLQIPDCTAHHWLASIRQSSSFAHIAQATQALTQLQNSLGLTTAATATTDFFLSSNLGENSVAIAFGMAFWLLVAGVIHLGRTKSIPRIAWLGSAFAVFSLTGFCWFFSKQLPLYQSVGREAADVAIYASAAMGNSIATLPAGTVVKRAEQRDGFTQITSPLPGWISDSALSIPFSGMPSSLRGAKHSAAR